LCCANEQDGGQHNRPEVNENIAVEVAAELEGRRKVRWMHFDCGQAWKCNPKHIFFNFILLRSVWRGRFRSIANEINVDLYISPVKRLKMHLKNV
jgi:hypothetical protein